MKRATVVSKHHPHDVLIQRPGPWGNPFASGTRRQNVNDHRAFVLASPAMCERIERELAGKVLGCCKPGACHGDVLAQIANRELDWRAK